MGAHWSRANGGRSARAWPQAAAVEELDTVDFEGGAHGIEIAGLHARHAVELLGAGDGGFRDAAALRQVADRPVEECARRANLGASDGRSSSLHRQYATLTRRHIYRAAIRPSQQE